jgi:hypothetical protein
MQQHLPQQEIQKTGLAIQAPSSNSNEMLKVATVLQQIVQSSVKLCQKKTKLLTLQK